MSSVLATLISSLEQFSEIVPVSWFVFWGAFIEEVIAPIPSPLVMTLAGTIAAGQNQTILFLVFLALLGAIGKTAASYLVYIFADKIEDIFFKKFGFGKLIGISHTEIESIGKHLDKNAKEGLILFLFRVIPIIPTAPVSVVAGLIKINLRTYLTTTLVGYFIRNFVYLYLGYTGIGALESLNSGLDSLESIGYLVIAACLGGAIGYAYLHRRKKGHDHILHKLTKKVKGN